MQIEVFQSIKYEGFHGFKPAYVNKFLHKLLQSQQVGLRIIIPRNKHKTVSQTDGYKNVDSLPDYGVESKVCPTSLHVFCGL